MKFAPRVASHSGTAETSDSLAYEPVQRLLAISTGDGRVKIFGRYGVESLLISRYKEGSRYLCFLPNSGSLVRITQSDSVELFDLDTCKVTAVVEFKEDAIMCLSVVPGQPYIMLGCVSGLLRVCCMVDGNLDPITQARPVIGLRILNYRVSKHAMGATGKMSSMSVCLSNAGPLALMIHSTSGLLVWNIRFARAVCALPHMSLDVLVSSKIDDPGDVTCAAWIGKLTSPCLFASGHDSGVVFTWHLPEDLRGYHDRRQMPIPKILHRLMVPPPRSLGSKIRSISFISGSQDGILVFGGQPLDEPAGLNIFTLDDRKEAVENVPLTGSATGLAWFGNILDFEMVPPKGSMEHFDDPAGIIVLTECGNLVMHDLVSRQPIPFSMPFQISQKHCSASFHMTLPTASPLKKFLNSKSERNWIEMEEIGGVFDNEYAWALKGGSIDVTAAEKNEGLLVLGYDDGIVRFWNLRLGVPFCSYALRPNHIFQSTSIKTIESLDEGSFLIVGDARGHVFLFQLSDVARSTKLRKFTTQSGTSEIEDVEQEAGYQLMAMLSLNEGSIQKIAFHTDAMLLASLDDTGGITVVNLITLDPIFIPPSATKAQHSVMDMTFCHTPVMTKDQETTSEVYLFVTDAASNLVAMDPSTGEIVKDSDWLHPRNASKSVRLLALDENGIIPTVSSVKLSGSEAFFWTASDPIDGDETMPASTSGDVKGDAVEETKTEPAASVSLDDYIDRSASAPVESSMFDSQEESPIHGHARDTSDDAETNAMLAAAVAEMDKTELKSNTPSRKALIPWKKKSAETSPKVDAKDTDLSDGASGLSSPVSISGRCLLLITEVYVRLYAPQSILASIRAPLHKVSFPVSIAWALPVTYKPSEKEDAESGLLLLTYDGLLHLLAVPSLTSVGVAKLDEIVDFPLYREHPNIEGSLSRLKLFEGDDKGGAWICSPNGELVHVNVVERPSQEDDVVHLYDWELAHAAHAASQLTQAGAPNANVSVTGERPVAVGTFRKGMDFFASLGRRARDELDKALRTTTDDRVSEVPSTSETYEPPSLDVLFCVNDHKPPPEIRSQHVRQASLQEPIRMKPGMHRPIEASDGTGTPENLTPRQRTAEEVRQKYGRSRSTYRSHTMTDELGGIMSENMSKLGERGQRLQTLNDKAEDMVNDAQSFADMAKQLAQQKSKKWWQF